MVPSRSADTKLALVVEQAFRLPRFGFVPSHSAIDLTGV